MTSLEFRIENPLNKIYLMRFMVLLLLIVPVGLLGQKSSELINSFQPDTIKKGILLPNLSSSIKSIGEYVQSNTEPPSEKIFFQMEVPCLIVQIFYKATPFGSKPTCGMDMNNYQILLVASCMLILSTIKVSLLLKEDYSFKMALLMEILASIQQ